MNVEISKEWSERMARLEPDNGEIGAGSHDMPLEDAAQHIADAMFTARDEVDRLLKENKDALNAITELAQQVAEQASRINELRTDNDRLREAMKDTASRAHAALARS
jgi:methyl-accepting chemotaxis protein